MYAIRNCTHIWWDKWPRKKYHLSQFFFSLFLIFWLFFRRIEQTKFGHRTEFGGGLLVFPLEHVWSFSYLNIFITSFMTLSCISENRRALRSNRIQHWTFYYIICRARPVFLFHTLNVFYVRFWREKPFNFLFSFFSLAKFHFKINDWPSLQRSHSISPHIWL